MGPGSICAMACLAVPLVATAAPPTGVVVVGDRQPTDAVLAEATRAGGATWRVEQVVIPAAPPQSEDPASAIERLYLEADFDRCLASGLAPELDLTRLVAKRALDTAAKVAVLVAACAHASSEKRRAEELLERALVMNLDVGAVLGSTRADFQQFAARVQANVTRRPRHRLEVRSEPAGGTVFIDGRSARCGPAACLGSGLAGEHVIVVERLGRRTRTATVDLKRDERIVLALDPAGADEARAQLSVAFHAPPAQPRATDEIAALAADAFGARVVVLVRGDQARGEAVLYDRATRKIAARVEIAGPNAVVEAVGQVIREWRADTGGRPLVRNPWFWTAVGAAALLTAGSVYFATTRQVQDDLVFR